MRISLLIVASIGLSIVHDRPSVAGDDKKASPAKAAKAEPLPVLHTLATESEHVGSVAFSPDGKVLAVAEEGRIAFWDPRTGKPAADPWKVSPEVPVRGIAFVGNKVLAVAQDTRGVVLREYPSGKAAHALALGRDQHAISLSASDDLLVATGSDFVRAWARPNWKERWSVTPASGDAPLEVALLPSRDELAVGISGVRGRVQIYATKDGERLRSAAADKHVLPSFRGLAHSPDGALLAIAPTSHPNPGRERPDDVLGMALFETDLSQHRMRLRWAVSGGEPYWCAFTPDGKTLVVMCRAGDTRFTGLARFYEVQTGGLRHVGEGPVSPVALSPSGSLLAFGGGAGQKSVVADWRAVKPLAARELSAFWSDLGSSDSGSGFRAVCGLGASPGEAVKLLGAKLKPVPVPDAGSVADWIADLGAEAFAAREAAEKELAKLGDAVEVELRAASQDGNAERRAAAFRLLKDGARPDAPDRLRALRAVEVLEYVGTPDAKAALTVLATGAPGAALTRDAKAALTRLTESKK